MAISLGRLAGYGQAVMRWGVGLVFLTFGLWQWINPTSWYGYLPATIPFGLDHLTAIHLNGTADTVLGLLLILGLCTRLVALLSALHVLGISLTLGWNDVAVRDIGFGIVLLGIFLAGEDTHCLDRRVKRFRSTTFGKILYVFG